MDQTRLVVTSTWFLGSAATNDVALAHALDEAVWNFGWSVSPDDAYQGLRGLRTLATRLKRHGESAMTIAKWLLEQSEVADVLYPPLPQSPDHGLWRRDFTGGNGLLSVVLGRRRSARSTPCSTPSSSSNGFLVGRFLREPGDLFGRPAAEAPAPDSTSSDRSFACRSDWKTPATSSPTCATASTRSRPGPRLNR